MLILSHSFHNRVKKICTLLPFRKHPHWPDLDSVWIWHVVLLNVQQRVSDTAVLPETLQGQNLDVSVPALFFCLSLCINTPYWHPEDRARRWMVWWSGPSLTAWALLCLRWYFSRQHRYQKRQSEGCTHPDWKNPWGWRSAHRRSRWMHLSGPVGGGGQFAGLYIPISKHTTMQQQWKINQTECATAPYFSEECVICWTSLL